jgi:hypothetical protein
VLVDVVDGVDDVLVLGLLPPEICAVVVPLIILGLESSFVLFLDRNGIGRGVHTAPRTAWCNYGHLDSLTRDSLFHKNHYISNVIPF